MNIIDYAILAQVKKMGNGGGGTSGGGKIEPFAITHNGTFAPTAPALEFGKYAKFKKVITKEDFETYTANATPLFAGEYETTIFLCADASGFPWVVQIAKGEGETGYALTDGSGYYTYLCGMENLWGYEDGWHERSSNGLYPVDMDLIAIGVNLTDAPVMDGNSGEPITVEQMGADLETTAIFFDTESRDFDGFGEISANVTLVPPTIQFYDWDNPTLLKISDANGDLSKRYRIFADGVLVATVDKAEIIDLSAFDVPLNKGGWTSITVVAEATSRASNKADYAPPTT